MQEKVAWLVSLLLAAYVFAAKTNALNVLFGRNRSGGGGYSAVEVTGSCLRCCARPPSAPLIEHVV